MVECFFDRLDRQKRDHGGTNLRYFLALIKCAAEKRGIWLDAKIFSDTGGGGLKIKVEEQYLSAAEIAKFLDVSYRTVENWAAKGHIARNNRKYGLFSALQYRHKQLKEQLEVQKSKLGMDELRKQKLVAEVDKERAIAKIKRLEADKLEEKLVDAEEVALAWKGYVLRCRAKLLSLPTKLALELASLNTESEIQQILEKTIDEALEELIVN